MMMEFRKVKHHFGDYLIIFVREKFNKPLAILTEKDIERLIKEWQGELSDFHEKRQK